MTKQTTEQKDGVNVAYQILKQGGRAMYFRELINEVVKIQGGAASAQVLAEVHTRLNMDSRFLHTGKGMWGLVEWSPQRSSASCCTKLRRVRLRTRASSSSR